MKRRTSLVTALVLISLPATLVVAEAVVYHLQNRNDGAIVSDGRERGYVLHVPEVYDGTRPVPLVISLHGAGASGASQRDLSRWNRVADEEGFLVVYPDGQKFGRVRVWTENDANFIARLIDTLEEEYAIDPARIYANGLSNGGGMSWVLSCTLPDRIAAVGMVGAAQTTPWEWCPAGRPVPVVNFHGTADTATPYRGGQSWVGPTDFPDVEEWTAKWAARNGCAAEPEVSRVAVDVVRRQYDGCEAPVVLYTIEGGGHTWPGGEPLPEWFLGPTSMSIDATRMMWTFFEQNPLRR